MFRITRQTDYGVVLLSHMATVPSLQVLTAKDAARWTGLPLPMVSKILKTLAREGLLMSHRGVKGGYSLAQRPEHIPISRVIEALEGPIGLTECASYPGRCGQEGSCPTRVNWQRINVAVRDALDKVVLADMLATTSGSLLRVGSAPAVHDAKTL